MKDVGYIFSNVKKDVKITKLFKLSVVIESEYVSGDKSEMDIDKDIINKLSKNTYLLYLQDHETSKKYFSTLIKKKYIFHKIDS